MADAPSLNERQGEGELNFTIGEGSVRVRMRIIYTEGCSLDFVAWIENEDKMVAEYWRQSSFHPSQG